MFSLFPKREKKPTEMDLLLADVEAKKVLRESRRQWAIEQATYVCAGCDVDQNEVMRAAKRFYIEAFGEEWDA